MNKKHTLKKSVSIRSQYLYFAFSLAALSVSSAFACDQHGKNEPHDHKSHAARGEGEAGLANVLANIGGRLEMVEDRKIGSSEVTALPVEAVLTKQGKNFVLTQSDEGSSEIIQREVTLGISDGQYVEAKTGVFPGDHVVVQLRNNNPENSGYANDGRNPRYDYGNAQQHRGAPQYAAPPQYAPRESSQRQPRSITSASPKYSPQPACRSNERNFYGEDSSGSRFIAAPSRCDFDRGNYYGSSEGACAFSRQQSPAGSAGGQCLTQDAYGYQYQPEPAYQDARSFSSEFHRGAGPDYRSTYSDQSTRHNHGTCSH